ncbi:DUF948 domain-containing protein [Brevibacillus reuszeri]|uniref:DUF948 domain-containing protein n=1 Tax=Brevibacillus reuszeri TaxID=54915 RepID=UPI00289C7B15|nr:DUF948 domain-containing protein [Brevibacillus reuszeri]
MLLEMSAVLVAIAFVILTFFLIQTLQSVKSSLDEVTQTLGQMKIEAREIGDEVKAVVGNANEMAVDLRIKLTKLDHLFSSVHDVGQVVHELTTTMKESASGFMSSMKQQRNKQAGTQRAEKWQAVLEGVLVATDVWLSMRSARAKPSSKTSAD